MRVAQSSPDTAGQDRQTDGVLHWLEGEVLPHSSQPVKQEVVDSLVLEAGIGQSGSQHLR